VRPAILVTAGPTREKIDPVRFISNYSTGAFGYEIARQAKARGCRVVLISGPVSIKPPKGVKVIYVESAAEMLRAVKREIKMCGCLIMAAAVSDWRARSEKKKKIKRLGGKFILELTENPDILHQAGKQKGDKVIVGFALETDNLKKNAARKMKEKNLDLIIANKASGRLCAFGQGKTSILILGKNGTEERFLSMPKRDLAKIILDKIFGLKYSETSVKI